jgi:hypothetical protein
MKKRLWIYQPIWRLLLPIITLLYDLYFFLTNPQYPFHVFALIFGAFLLGLPFTVWFKWRLNLALPLIARIISTDNPNQELRAAYSNLQATLNRPVIYQILFIAVVSVLTSLFLVPASIKSPFSFEAEKVLLIFINGTLLNQILTFREYFKIYQSAREMNFSK